MFTLLVLTFVVQEVDMLTVYEATVTRITPTHIWFVFSEDQTEVEHFCLRGNVSPKVNRRIVVEEIEPGLWFLTDGTVA